MCSLSHAPGPGWLDNRNHRLVPAVARPTTEIAIISGWPMSQPCKAQFSDTTISRYWSAMLSGVRLAAWRVLLCTAKSPYQARLTVSRPVICIIQPNMPRTNAASKRPSRCGCVSIGAIRVSVLITMARQPVISTA